jgi:microsomal dipeptidase-like Zn-dependent dipeptidase
VTVQDVANHVEHIGRIAGRDHVGLGGDYDGVTYLPEGMGGVDGYTVLAARLERCGHCRPCRRQCSARDARGRTRRCALVTL